MAEHIVVITKLDRRVCRGARRRRIRALPEAVESSGIVLANQAGRIYMRFMAFRLLVPSVSPVPNALPPPFYLCRYPRRNAPDSIATSVRTCRGLGSTRLLTIGIP